MQRSARQRKPNVWYAEYIYTKTDDKIGHQTPMEEDEIEDDIGAGVLEYVLTQHSLSRRLKLCEEKG